MDKNTLVAKLNKAAPGTLLDVRRFGQTPILSIWVEAQSLGKIAAFLKQDSQLKLDWLENLTVVEIEDALVVSLFARSTSTLQSLIIRASIVPSSPEAEVVFPSVQSVWSMSEPMEHEARELFGVRFQNKDEIEPRKFQPQYLPEGWQGFPLRKNYKFPKEFHGITHFRPFNPMGSKKLPQ